MLVATGCSHNCNYCTHCRCQCSALTAGMGCVGTHTHIVDRRCEAAASSTADSKEQQSSDPAFLSTPATSTCARTPFILSTIVEARLRILPRVVRNSQTAAGDRPEQRKRQARPSAGICIGSPYLKCLYRASGRACRSVGAVEAEGAASGVAGAVAEAVRLVAAVEVAASETRALQTPWWRQACSSTRARARRSAS